MGAADLDDDVRRVDPDRWHASRFIADPVARADVVALYAFDHQLARAARVASNPLIAEIRLVWWREAVDEIWAGRPARAHPIVQALAAAHGRHRLRREALEAMIEARIDVLERPTLDASRRLAWADATGGSAAILAASIVDSTAPAAAAAAGGRVWGLVMLARQGLADRALLVDQLRTELAWARRAARRLSPQAFPAVVQATLARGMLRSIEESDLARRLRMFWAVATGGL